MEIKKDEKRFAFEAVSEANSNSDANAGYLRIRLSSQAVDRIIETAKRIKEQPDYVISQDVRLDDDSSVTGLYDYDEELKEADCRENGDYEFEGEYDPTLTITREEFIINFFEEHVYGPLESDAFKIADLVPKENETPFERVPDYVLDLKSTGDEE
jgi:hypothetical protein